VSPEDPRIRLPRVVRNGLVGFDRTDLGPHCLGAHAVSGDAADRRTTEGDRANESRA
jgi:hypothetical protein